MSASTSQVNEYLRSIVVPSLVYVGGADAYREPASEAARHLPQVTVARIAVLNHIEAYFRADLVLSHVRQFLAEVEAG